MAGPKTEPDSGAPDDKQEPAKTASESTAPDDGSRWSFGLTAVWVGVVGIIVALIVGVIAVYVAGDRAVDVATVASPAIAAISSITAAYFGIKLGQEGTKEATENAKQANETAVEATKAAGDAAARASATKGVALAHARVLETASPASGRGGGSAAARGAGLTQPSGPRALTAAELEDLIDRATK